MDNDKLLELIYDLEFTKYEAKLLVLLISQIDKNDVETKNYSIKILEVYNKNSVENIDFSKLKTFLQTFLAKTLLIEKDDNNFLIINLVSTIEYKNEFLNLIVPKEIITYLFNFKTNFVSYEFEDILKLSDRYSIGAYLIIKEFLKTGNCVIPLDKLHKDLKIENSLLVYSHFKKKVLEIVTKKITQLTDINLSYKEIKTGRKVTDIYFLIESKSAQKYENLFEIKEVEKQTELVEVKNIVPEIVNEKDFNREIVISQTKIDMSEDVQDDISRVVRIFDQERRKLQPNYVRNEYKNMDGAYLLRLHIAESGRTPKMFFDAVRWLFSTNPKAEFHRQYIMNIGKLIQHFNTLEHQSMYSKEAIEFTQEAKILIRALEKRGASENEIKAELKKGGFIKDV